jgi:hypothetical protein
MSIPAAWPQVLDFFGTPLVQKKHGPKFSADLARGLFFLDLCGCPPDNGMRSQLKRLKEK